MADLSVFSQGIEAIQLQIAREDERVVLFTAGRVHGLPCEIHGIAKPSMSIRSRQEGVVHEDGKYPLERGHARLQLFDALTDIGQVVRHPNLSLVGLTAAKVEAPVAPSSSPMPASDAGGGMRLQRVTA